MLKKIIAIKNIGRFRNSATAGNQLFAKYAFIVGANGFGKTTICAVLRSLQSGDSSHVLGRKTLGSTEASTIELLLDTGATRFDGTAWSATHSAIAIFDGVFVAENVYSGEVVEIDHRRNLYRIIIGADGVRLAAEDADLAGQSRTKTSEISAASKAIQSHVPNGMKLETFLALPATPDIDSQIAEQGRVVEAIRQAAVIRERSLLAEIRLPVLPVGFIDLFGRTINDIAQDAEQRIAEHFATHGITSSKGGSWIAKGIEHATGESCPFCGQDIHGIPLIAAYRELFSARYKALEIEIVTMRDQLVRNFGDTTLARLDTLAEQHKNGVEFWGRYCDFDPATLNFPGGVPAAIRELGQSALALLDIKARAPLQAIAMSEAFTVALDAYGAADSKTETFNDAIKMVNALATAKKVEIGMLDIKTASAELAYRAGIKARHDEAISKLCDAYVRLCGQKDLIDKCKETVRAELDTHTNDVVKPYERKINKYLSNFNAGFSITETKHSYLGGVATSNYQLVINDKAIDVGDGRTPANKPSFKNTLSAGDRTTLALAFFLAHLERDQELARKIVVFDDPFNSQDAFRRRQTVHEIMKVAGKCAQIIVLSHDATFVKQVWDKAPTAERVALTIADHRAQGSKISIIDLEKACLGRTASDIDDLQTYLSTGAGQGLDIIRKIRGVLETYCRTTYSSCFTVDDWLGEIVRKTREGGATHPAIALYDAMDQINDYTKQYHHGENAADTTPDQIDSTELTGFTKTTLQMVNALQA